MLNFIRAKHTDSRENGTKEMPKNLTDSRAKREHSRTKRERTTKHDERLERLSNEATQAAKERFAAASSPPIISIDSTGELSESVIDSLSLSDLEVESLKSTISEIRSEEAKKFAERAELITEAEEQNAAGLRYLVRAKPDKGTADKQQFAEKVGQVLNDSRSIQLVGGVGEYDFYGGFGKYDVELDFYSEDGVDMVKYRYINPANGNTSRFGEGKLDDFNYSSWKALDLPKH